MPGRNRDFGYNRRSFLLYVPTSTRGPFAVVFLWGAGGQAEGGDEKPGSAYRCIFPGVKE